MDSIKIPKQKHIQLCLLLFFGILLLGLTIFAFVLGLSADDWVLQKKFGIIIACVLAGELIIPVVVFFLLRVTNKQFYLITPKGITLFKATQEVFFIPVSSIKNLRYLGFRYAFMFQMGAGYLHVPFEEARGNIKPTMTFPDLSMLLGIDMSEKQAVQVARILGKDLQK